MAELFDQVRELALLLFDMQALMSTLKQPQYLVAMFVLLNLIIFTETGLLIGFFLPGDSLLVSVGVVFYSLIHDQGVAAGLLPLLIVTLCASAIIGDTVGYGIGRRTGPRLFSREQSFFFRKNHLLAAAAFYERHGGKTIVLARFIPILRTFAPVVAGIGQMEYRRFLFYNIFGGIGWVSSMILIGYFLPPVLNPLLRPVFGDDFQIDQHIEKVIIVVVFCSIAPGIVGWIKHRFSKRKAEVPAPTTVI